MSAEGMTGASADLVELLTSQHRQVEQLWSMLQVSHADGSSDQVRLSEEIVRLLSQHDALETQLLYPELRSSAGEEGQRLSDHSLDEHKEVRDLLSQVDGEDPHDQSVFSTLSQSISAVTGHVDEEENQVFPLLRQHCDEARLTELGQQAAEMLKVAPTHPHPHTPDSKLGATVAGTVSGMMDKARDAVRDSGQS